MLRGWGHHYKRAQVRKLFHRLDGWILRRIRSQRFKRWRNGGWRQLPETKLYGEYGLAYLLRGDLDVRFVLKITTVLVIAGGVFAYYLDSLRPDRLSSYRNRLFAIVALVIVGFGVVVGFAQIVCRFSVKWRVGGSPLVSIPPLRGGDFQGIRVYRSDVFLGRARKANFRAQPHRLDEPTKLSLGMVASLQSPLLFHLAMSL